LAIKKDGAFYQILIFVYMYIYVHFASILMPRYG